MRQIDDAARLLDKVQASYAHNLVKVDRLLRSAVAQDPKCLQDARAVQARYFDVPHEKFLPARLAPLEQPEAKHNDPQPREQAIEIDGSVSQPVADPIRDADAALEPAAAFADQE